MLYCSLLCCYYQFSGQKRDDGYDFFQIMEVRYLGNLPCLESVDLRGNPVTATLDYRTNMFEMFGERAKEVGVFVEVSRKHVEPD